MSENGLSLRSLEDVERMARIAVASGFTACRKPEEAAVILLTGQELGLSPMQSLRGIYVVSGRPVLAADTMVAVVRRSGLCESWRTVESTAERCEIWTLRKGDEVVSKRVWTMADAKRAGITGKQTWAQYPAAMLRHRCAADLAREVYPDVILGMYDPEELEPAPREDIPALASMGVEVQRPTLPAPSSWSTDLAACDTLADVCAAYRASVRDDTAAAMRDDVRAWLGERGIPGVTAAETTALLSTLPDDARRVLSELWCDEEHPVDERCVTAARAVKAAQWDAHSQKIAHAVVTRCYAVATGAGSIREAGAALVAARDAEHDTDDQHADAAARIATKATRPALVNSIRAHAAEILADVMLAGLYAAQWVKVNAAPNDPRPLPEQYDDALARVRTLATEASAKGGAQE